MSVNLDPIALVDGEISGKVLLHESSLDRSRPRGRRDSARRVSKGVTVCFTPSDESGRVEHVECPLVDLSSSGLGLTFDKPIDLDRACEIAFQTASHRLVRVHARVKRCMQVGENRYEVGLQFTHRLTAEQQKIVRRRPGRDITIGSRMRPLVSTAPVIARGLGGGYAGPSGHIDLHADGQELDLKDDLTPRAIDP